MSTAAAFDRLRLTVPKISRRPRSQPRSKERWKARKGREEGARLLLLWREIVGRRKSGCRVLGVWEYGTGSLCRDDGMGWDECLPFFVPAGVAVAGRVSSES